MCRGYLINNQKFKGNQSLSFILIYYKNKLTECLRSKKETQTRGVVVEALNRKSKV